MYTSAVCRHAIVNISSVSKGIGTYNYSIVDINTSKLTIWQTCVVLHTFTNYNYGKTIP